MSRSAIAAFIAAPLLAAGIVAALAQQSPSGVVMIDQGIEQPALVRYHYTDQGTRLLPAAWLAALEKPDGSGKFMNADDLRRMGFITEGVEKSAGNPFGWPLGVTIGDPSLTDGIPIAGFTCAMCHTGQLEFKGKIIRIEGGQAHINLPSFIAPLVEAFTAMAQDSERRAKFFKDAIAEGYPAERMESDFRALATVFSQQADAPSAPIIQLDPGHGRLDAVQGIANQVFGTDLAVPINYRDLDAPVNFPYLWDIWRLSWLQYNAFLPPQATSRNIGEVLGTRGKTNIVDPLTGKLNPEPERWKSSVHLPNILWMEELLHGLRAPTWPADVLGPLAAAKAETGKGLFTENCAGCHGIKELPDGNWDVTVVPLEHIGTDPGQAANWAGRTYDASKIGMSDKTPAYDLDVAINAIRKQLYADFKTPPEEQEPDVDFEAPCGYKARPLIGVWATPPFLHNGSVRTVFDLLSETRPASFAFGSREFDPVHLGYIDDAGPAGSVLDASVPGNLNTGHWWTDDAGRPGRIGPKLSDADKYAIIEFLKSATYENYPRRKVDKPARMPCQDDKEWAIKGRAGPEGQVPDPG